ncbi:MAG: DMT family transporter [Hyphomicrobiales bacterium]|nr:DMT family transporter [Hyphomicrobiales bacterium]
MDKRPLVLRRSLTDWLLLAGLVLFWGSSFALTKIAVASIAPLWVVALRLGIAAVLLSAVALTRGLRVPGDWRSWTWFGWLALTGSFAPFLLISWGTQYIDSGLAGILISAVPIFVVSFGHVMLPDEPMNRFKVAGFTLGMVGVVALIGPDRLMHFATGGIALLAEMAVLAATVSYALQAVTARLMRPMSVTIRAASVLMVSAAFSLGMALTLSPNGLAAATPGALAATVGLGVFPTALGALALFRLLDRAGAGFVSTSNYLIPAVAVLIGTVFLGEQLEWRALAGLALILAGIALSERRRALRRPPQPPLR